MSKFIAEQSTLDLDGVTVESYFNRLAHEEAKHWTEEALCVAWLSGRNAMDWEWWRGLKNYERANHLNDYQAGREAVECGRKMPTPGYLQAKREEEWRETQAIAKRWASEIREAFKDGRPCPFKVDRLSRFSVALDLAIDLAGIPPACLKHQPEENHNHEDPESQSADAL